ncbi:MAG: tetratricopeptide repeat protein, partial [Caldilinea sp.]|nr:tetratricopeptide repeat protein [Caldilinea sp.]
YYARRAYDQAIDLWERAAALDPQFATVHRNLGLAYMNKRGDAERARASYARAVALDSADARVFFELDQLDKKLGRDPAERLANLAAHRALVDERDDLTVEYVTLLNLTGRHAEALDVLTTRTFHPWEGGEGKVSGQYVAALVELAKQALDAGDARAALALLERARTYPDNLAEGKLAGAQENAIHYQRGRAFALLGDPVLANEAFRLATRGSAELGAALYYNDQPPEMVLYQALAHAALGNPDRAGAICKMLVDYGETHAGDEVKMDYFAVSLPDFVVFEDDLA